MRSLGVDTPLFPALGNHDRNAMLYYDLMALPSPGYRYAFRAGDAEFFVIDTERPVGPGSSQYRWLESALKRSPAKWKIIAHHYPPYSSDLDDYGTDLGDLAARELVPLYDRYQVDLVFSGHIHSYERTYPLRNGAVVKNGTNYIVIGGGGGDLEQFLPIPPGFSAYRKSAHHYGIVDITSRTLKLQVYDLSGQIFDTFEIQKL
jgi:acid phosphatase type 7